MSSTLIRLDISSSTRPTLERFQTAAPRLLANLNRAVEQGLDETAQVLKRSALTGGNWKTPRLGQSPLAVRSGALRQSITFERDGHLTGTVGSGSGAASAYARVQLGAEDTTIKPSAGKKYLAIPIADGLNPSGLPNQYTLGGPRNVPVLTDPQTNRQIKLRIFRSRAGNLVGFLPTGGVFKRGAKKGQQKGLLLFVFKEQVEIKAGNRLAATVQAQTPRLLELLQQGVNDALGGPS